MHQFVVYSIFQNNTTVLKR